MHERIDSRRWTRAVRFWLTAPLAAAVIVAGGVLPGTAEAAAATATISGSVFTEAGEPATGVRVTAHSPQEEFAAVEVDGGGHFEVTITPGSVYTILFQHPDPKWVIEDHLSKVRVESTQSTVDVGRVTLQLAGSISGRVVDSSGEPVLSGSVRAYRMPAADGSEVAPDIDPAWLSHSVAAPGEFLIGRLPAGRYLLRYVLGSSNGLAPVWWPGVPDEADAEPIEIGVGEDRSGVVLPAPDEASISGTVRLGPGGTSATATVTVERWSGVEERFAFHSSTRTYLDGDGTTERNGGYRLGDLPAGTYRVRSEGSSDATAWWRDALTEADATTIDLVAGQDVGDVDMTVPTAGSIEGVVRGPDGQPIAGTEVEIARPSKDVREPWYAFAEVTTDADGRYVIPSLRAGRYTLNFHPPAASGAAREWWGNAVDAHSAAAIELEEYEHLVLDDATLQEGSRITGTILGGVPYKSGYTAYFDRIETIPGGEHEVQEARLDTYRYGEAAGWGPYISPPLPAGTYLVSISPLPDWSTLLSEWWPGALTPEEATRITLEEGEIRNGVDTELARGGTISGRVRWEEGGPANGVDVRLHTRHVRPDGSIEWLFGPYRTVRNGKYSFDGLPPGTYTLHFSPDFFSSPGLLDEWWENRASSAEAVPIDLGLSEDFVGDATMGRLRVAPDTPEITGSPRVGATLEASEGTWSPAASFTYQWTADGAALTGATSRTLRLTTAHLGKRISVRVRGSYESYIPAEASATPTSVVRGGAVATGPVEVRGIPRLGARVSAATGAGWDTSARLTYQWKASERSIPGATTASLVLGPETVGKRISVSVTASRTHYDSVTVTSPSTPATAAGLLTAPTPTISGTAVVGGKLTASRGTWTSGTAISYRWKADGKPIAGATASTFTIPSSLRGDRITVTVTGRKTGYATAAVTSRATTRVMLAGTPAISGAPAVGRRLTAKPGTWTTGATLRYQWYANGSRITGATKSTWTITKSQRGKVITVKVTGAKSGYTTVTKTSRGSTKVR
ncbi:carboxypeptidase regulatory-like domain-containing protein [Microbacterium sp.]|uniref:carboxypeptidase regulatory-like domain-containing protein n=1 Tax=Microbacterium sp. TaxID=51671 RepID=UPI0039E562D6